MKTYTISSFAELNNIFKEHWNGHYIYRGEDSPKYDLIPSYGRDKKKNIANNDRIEVAYLREFKRKAIPFLEYTPTSELDWIALAQHHGLHTRLLDWSTNPLVATYFAVRNYLHNDDRVIYILNTSKFSIVSDDINPFSIDSDYLYYPKHLTQRITVQSGLFTLHHEPINPLNGDFLEKVIIKNECIVELLTTLRVYNIDEFTMFPGLNGLSTLLTESYIRG